MTVKCDCGLLGGMSEFLVTSKPARVLFRCPACGVESDFRYGPGDNPLATGWRRKRRPGEQEPGILPPGARAFP